MHRTLRLQESSLDGAYASYPSGHLWILTPMFPNWLITSLTTTRNQSVDGLFPLYVSLCKKVRPAITNSVGKTSRGAQEVSKKFAQNFHHDGIG